MKTFLRILGGLVLVIVVLAAGAFLFLYLRQPKSAPAQQISVDMSPDRIDRGRYIFTALADCDGCHSQRDFSRLGGPVIAAGRGSGNEMPLKGLPGRVVAYNLTPDKETGLGTWTDGEKIRAIREGIDKDGNMLFPLMPYPGYRFMSDYDVESLVAYMNTLTPIRNPLPRTKIDFLVNLMIKGVPRPVDGRAKPIGPGDARYGEYLATLGGCEECHTPMTRGQADPAMRFAGGRVFSTPFGDVVSANITPDNETGLGKWDFARFHDRIETYRAYHNSELPKIGPDRFTLMPWLSYADLTDQDLSAIFGYIKGRTPISHKVEPHPGFPAATN